MTYADRYFMWKDPHCKGINPEWIEMSKDEYIAFLYDRVPTLPQSLKRDLGVIPHLWTNIAYRVARTVKS